MKQYLFILFSSVSFTAISQNALPMYFDSIGYVGNYLEWDESIDFHSTSIKNDVATTFIWGGEIDQSMKDRSMNKHKGVNRLGFYNSNELRYLQLNRPFLGKEILGWGVKAGYYAAGSISYNKDLFGLMLYGNGAYLNQTADFSATQSHFMLFQKAGFGLVDRRTKSALYLNVVNVQQAFNASEYEGKITQNEDGSNIDLALDGAFAFTEGNQFSKGLGIAIDGEYRFLAPWINDSKAPFSVAVNNLGAAYMFEGMSQYTVDSNYNYNGFTVNQLANSEATFGDDFDVYDSLRIEKTEKRTWLALPGYIQMSKLIDDQSSKKIQSFFGMRIYPTMRAVPAVFAGINYRPIRQFSAAASVYYGGFGRFRGGIYVHYVTKKVLLGLGTDDVLGFVSKNGFGQSLMLKLSWKLN